MPKGLTVESIAPFNEPDYTSWNEGSNLDFLNICKKIRADKELDGIRLCGGNTLNCDLHYVVPDSSSFPHHTR